MGKRARKTPAARISRSGLWLIGGVALLSLAVLAWALQGDGGAVRQGVHGIRHSGVQGNRPERLNARTSDRPKARTSDRPNSAAELAARPPSVDDYGPLLQGNVFQPRVVPPQSRSAAKSTSSEHPASSVRRRGDGAPGEPVAADGWHNWKYSGIAELDQRTYALMDQPDKKQSQFVKVGDHLEDATIISVAENEVTLRQADSSVVRMKRVDPVADQLRSLRAATPAPAAPGLAAPGAAPALVPGQGMVAPFPYGQAAPQQPAAGYNSPAGGATGRRRRRSQQQDNAGDAGVQ